MAFDDAPMFKRAFLSFAVLACGAAAAFPATPVESADPAPDLTDARVTIPYSELKTLWTAAQQVPVITAAPLPPVDSTLVSAHYQLAINGEQATGSVDFETQDFTDQWIVMPLLGTEAQLESVQPADAQIIVRDGFYAFVSNHPGKQVISIRFAAKVNAVPDGAQLRMAIAPASINTLTVTGVPQKQALRVADGTEVSEDNTGAKFLVAPKDHLEVNILAEKSLAAPIPSAWNIEPQAFVHLTDGKLAYQTRVAASASNGSGLSIDLQIPPDANVSNITGDDIAGWQIKTGENQTHLAHIQWQTRDILRRQVEILYDLPQPLTAAEWKLESPRAVGGATSPPLYMVALEPGLELTTKAANAVPRQLPNWLAAHADGTNYLIFVGEQPLQARWLPLIETPHAVAESVQAKMQIVTDGALLTEVDYSIRHETAFAWQLTLPEGAELLASSVDGRQVNPIDRGAHVIEFSLPAGAAASQVKVSYTSKGPAFEPVSGKLDLDLPQTDLLTNKLDWELQIPAAYEVAAFQGNVEPGTNTDQPDPNSRLIRLHREIFKGEHPSVELFYQKPEAAQ
jgi:hypothetical protein